MKTTSFELAAGVRVGEGAQPVFFLGPCVIESEESLLAIAGQVREIAERHSIQVVFNASYDKANRTSIQSFRGPGLQRGLRALSRVKEEVGLAVMTDVHQPDHARPAAAVGDVLQVPAFLCRQTDILLACGETGSVVNIKKGQFVAPGDMANAVEKVRSTGNSRVMVTERGATFGYNNLVVDVRSFPIMRGFAPVVFDVTHSLQLPGGLGDATAGAREFHPHLARAAAGAGVDGFFAEVHPDPARALSDATTQLTPGEADRLVGQVQAISSLVRELES